MPATFKVDQTATFQGVVFNTSAPKMQFGTDKQEANNNGVPKWEVQVTAMSVGFNGKIETEVLKVGVVAPTDPGQNIAPFTPVQLVDFEVGFMDRKDRNTGQLQGGQVWYRASEIRDNTQPPAGGRNKGGDA